MTNREILLDEEAQKLFEQLGGIDTRRHAEPAEVQSDLTGVMLEEENRRDEWRALIVEIVYLFSGFLTGVRRSGMTPKYKEELESLLAVLAKVSGMPGHNGELLIRYRGGNFARPQSRLAPKDSGGYVVSLGHHVVDLSVTKAMANRRGVVFSHLPGRFSSSCSAMASLELHTLHLDLRNWTEQGPLVRQSLAILARYFMVLGGTLKEAQGDQVPLVMSNENDQPDPNLTMVAGLNNVSRKTLGDLVMRIKGMMNNPGMEQFTSVYGALFAFRQVREKWVKSPLEINNLRWLVTDKEGEVLDKDKSILVRKIVDQFATAMPQATQVIQGVYGSDFPDIEADLLDERLSRVGDFLESIGTGEEAVKIEAEVLRNIERRLDRVPDEMYDRLAVRGDILERETGLGETISSKINTKIADLISFFKRRTGVKKKMREMVRGPSQFTEQDYETIARDFKFTVEEVKALLGLVKGCFGEDGHFLRGVFEKNIPNFARHEKVFALLWHYLREITGRKDRVAYLNSLQALVSYMANPYESMLILLGDLLKAPDAVDFSDRNTVMLCNAFLQTTLGSQTYDSEMTPEEVLQAEERLNKGLIGRVSEHLEVERDRFFQKIRTIHELLTDSLLSEKPSAPTGSFRFLSVLERELYIFLSLAGGAMAHTVIRSAVREYGNSASEVYNSTQSVHHAKGLIQLLQVSVRGLARFKDEGDLPLIYKILEQEKPLAEFARKGNADFKRLIGWVERIGRELKTTAGDSNP